MTPKMRDALHAMGKIVSFADGDLLRQKGAFAPDILLITRGQVDCVLSEGGAVHLPVGPGAIVGEIGFLTGQAATATLRALGPVDALTLDARALQQLRRNDPAVAADVLRLLARLLHERSIQNEGLVDVEDADGDAAIAVVRCSTFDQKRTAQRVRYDVHCLENGFGSAFADDDEGIIADDLDRTGTSFLAFTGVQAIAMMRVNFIADCDTPLQEFHGRTGADVSPENIVAITASSIQEAHRSDALYGLFFNAISTFAQASGAVSIMASCTPDQKPHYTAHGFRKSGPIASLPEVGLSVPLALTITPSGATGH